MGIVLNNVFVLTTVAHQCPQIRETVAGHLPIFYNKLVWEFVLYLPLFNI